MRSRQRVRRWLIVTGDVDESALRSLPRGSGIILLGRRPELARHLRLTRRARKLVIVEEASGRIARVHDLRELRRALLARTPMILLSPIHPTASHPDWLPIPRMRAAALARLARRQLIALGGMDDTRFRRIAPLGFQGWAGISAWLLRT